MKKLIIVSALLLTGFAFGKVTKKAVPHKAQIIRDTSAQVTAGDEFILEIMQQGGSIGYMPVVTKYPTDIFKYVGIAKVDDAKVLKGAMMPGAPTPMHFKFKTKKLPATTGNIMDTISIEQVKWDRTRQPGWDFTITVINPLFQQTKTQTSPVRAA